MDFLDGYGFLVSDGEVSEDELDSSMPGLPTSTTNIPVHIIIVQLCWLMTACGCIKEWVKQLCVPWANVLAQVPYVNIFAQNYIFVSDYCIMAGTEAVQVHKHSLLDSDAGRE